MAGTLLSGTIYCVSYLINAAGESFSDWRLSAESLSMGVWRRAVDLRVQIYTIAQALKAFAQPYVRGPVTSSALPLSSSPFASSRPQASRCTLLSHQAEVPARILFHNSFFLSS